jgi:hypothetical protein
MHCGVLLLQVAFLKDLSTFWQQFDDRLLLHKVLPPIVQVRSVTTSSN